MRSVRNCSVAVIGGAGFLGSHAVNHLIEDRGCDVLVVDNLAAGRREFVHPKAKFVHHDITGSESYLRNLFIKHKVRFVGNWAAHPYIPDSFARPIHVCDVNFVGAMKVVNAAQEAGCDGVLQVSSAEIYGEGAHTPLSQQAMTDAGESVICGGYGTIGRDGPTFRKITEQDKVAPHSSYGVAKAAVDSWVQCRWKEAGTPCIALRQFNCLGERETHPYIVPEIISQLSPWRGSGSKPTIKLGNNSFRDFMYAGDAVRIAVELMERGQWGEVYNLGSETGVKMYDLAKLIGKLMGFADVEVFQDPDRVRPWEIWWLQSCNDKIQAATNYQRNVTTNLETSLKRTIEYFNSNGRKWVWQADSTK